MTNDPLSRRGVAVVGPKTLRHIQREIANHVVVEGGDRIRLPRWATRALSVNAGDRLLVMAIADLIVLGGPAERRFNRALLRNNGSIPLPQVVLEAASKPLVLEPLAAESLRLGPAAPPAETPVPVTGPEAFPASISAAGRLRVPAALLEHLAAAPGDEIVFGQQGDGSFELRRLASVIARCARDLSELLAGGLVSDELIEERRAEAREEATDDPLAGHWQG